MFNRLYEQWMQRQIDDEPNRRRRELLEKGLSHGSVELLRTVWLPAVGNFDFLYPEWEVRDYRNGYRYLDFAYLPAGGKGDVEVHDYRSHARDVTASRFMDLCRRQSLLSLDDWVYLPIAYLSIQEEPEFCKQLVLSFVGKFLSHDVDPLLNSMEAETLRFARRLLRPFTPRELAGHLRITDRYARQLLRRLVDRELVVVAGGNVRFRTYQLHIGNSLKQRGSSTGVLGGERTVHRIQRNNLMP